MHSSSNSVLQEAVAIIHRGEFTCVVIQDDKIVHKADGRGVSPLLYLYENEPEKLLGATVADKIIGKAAAMILVLGGVKFVYGDTMSAVSLSFLEKQGICAEYGCLVEMIINRTNTGVCPIEQSVLECDDAHEGLENIKRVIKILMQ